MNSFTRKLVLNCTGVIFISFLVVYFLFNALVTSYIRDMAERELADGVDAAITMTGIIPYETMTAEFTFIEPPQLNVGRIYAPQRAVRWHMDPSTFPNLVVSPTDVHDSLLVAEQIAPPPTVAIEGVVPSPTLVEIDELLATAWHDSATVHIYTTVDGDGEPTLRVISTPPTPHFADIFETEYYLAREVTPAWVAASLPGFDLVTDDGSGIFVNIEQIGYLDMGTRLAHGQLRSTHHGIPTLINTNVVMLNGNDEIISPFLQTLTYQGQYEVEFLVDYFLQNQTRLATNGMTQVSGLGSTYYIRTISRTVPGSQGPASILLYTDISSAVAFQTSMNRILGILLALSGLCSLTIAVAMSVKFKRAISRLCNHAEAIGRGNWAVNAGNFSDAEFNRLSKSMDNMSEMLQAYESNQKRFFQNVSHELRTPLMSIQGYAEGILQNIFSKDDAANVILSEGQKMDALVEDLLYISRIDSNVQGATNIATLDVKNLLHECLESVKPIAQKSDKQVIIDLPEYEITVEAEEEQFARAILNILSNAIRHAKNEVKISCNASTSEVEIIIRDDGQGVKPADAQNIFKRFYKGENGNHGLGLAISKDIVHNMGGKIYYTTDEGAVFIVSLPAA